MESTAVPNDNSLVRAVDATARSKATCETLFGRERRGAKGAPSGCLGRC